MNIFKKKIENVNVEGAETAAEVTPAEPGKKRNKIVTAVCVAGAAIVGTVAALALKACNDGADAEMRSPDADEPIEVTDEMLEEVIE